MRRHITPFILAGLLALAGCGGDDEEEGGGAPASDGDGGGGALTLTADPGGALSWEPSELTAAAGAVEMELVNESSVPHAIAFDGVEQASDTITEATTTVSVDLEPGEYTYFCPVGNHRQAGMEGTLTVE